MNHIYSLLFTLFISMAALGQSTNYSLNFDGTDDTVSLGANFSFQATDQFTVEAWIKAPTSGSFAQVVSKLDSGFTGWGLQVRPEGNLSAYLFSSYGVNQRFVNGTALIADNQWHHVAMTFDGVDTIVLYVDGVLDPISGGTSLGATLGSVNNTADASIGSYEGDGFPGEFFSGNIDDVRIWTGIRSDAQIFSTFNTELSGSEAGLIGYYKLDTPGTACDVLDCSISQINGLRSGVAGANEAPEYGEDVAPITDVGCGVASECTLAIGQFSLNTLSLFPNPTNGIITVNGSHTLNEINVTVYNVIGSQILKNQISQNQIDLSGQPSGVYLIKLEHQNSKVIKKVVKL